MKTNKNSKNILKISLLLLGIIVICSFGVNSVAAASNTTNQNITHKILSNVNNPDPYIQGSSTSYNTIQDAVDNAQSGDTIILEPGTYTGTGNYNIEINKDLTLIGGNNSNNPTIINAQGIGTIFNITSGVTVTLENLMLTNGNSTDFGGALYNQGTLNINNCTFINNNASAGGAIYNEYGSLIESSNIFINNNASIGGAIYNECKYTNINSIFNSNIASTGGAIYNKYGSLTESSSTFTHNNADNGGVIYNYGGEVTVNYCRITGNTTPDIYNDTNAITGMLYVDNNWWGTNNPNFNQLISGSVTANSWLVLNNLTANGSVIANHTIILNGGNSTVTAKLQSYNKVSNTYTPISECAPVPISFTATCGNITPISTLLINGLATSLFTAKSTGTANINAMVDNQTIATSIFVTQPTLNLTTKISTSTPTVNVPYNITFDLTTQDEMDNGIIILIRLTNSDVTSASCDLGHVILRYYDSNTGALEDNVMNINNNSMVNTIVNWTLPYVPGDPFLSLTVIPLTNGNYNFTPVIISNASNIIQYNIPTLTLNVQQPTDNTGNQQTGNISGNTTRNQQPNNSSSVTVKAASKTIGMQNTGVPMAGFILAILAVFGGILVPRKK